MITAKNHKIISVKTVEMAIKLMKVAFVSTMTLIVWKASTRGVKNVRVDIM